MNSSLSALAGELSRTLNPQQKDAGAEEIKRRQDKRLEGPDHSSRVGPTSKELSTQQTASSTQKIQRFSDLSSRSDLDAARKAATKAGGAERFQREVPQALANPQRPARPGSVLDIKV
ncbi:MAG: hypothetical protein V3R73_04915 [Sphingomonadales bacterium]